MKLGRKMKKAVPSVLDKGGSWDHQCVLLAVTRIHLAFSMSQMSIFQRYACEFGKEKNLAGYERPGVRIVEMGS